jgi:predicted nucleotidyltransferase
MNMYTLTNMDGNPIGRIGLENDEVPQLIIGGAEFKLGGAFYPKSRQFMNFILVPQAKLDAKTTVVVDDCDDILTAARNLLALRLNEKLDTEEGLQAWNDLIVAHDAHSTRS